MSDRFRITIAQLNPVVGDIPGNAAKAYAAWEKGRRADTDLVVTSELFLSGYNPQDLVTKPAFQQHIEHAIHQLSEKCADGPMIAIGAPYVEDSKLFNACYFLQGGQIRFRCLKHHLPNETVFDELRVFDSGPLNGPFRIGNIRAGILICEDAWKQDVAETLVETGADFLLVPNGSPYYRGKFETRLNHMVSRVIETDLPLIYVNMVGGQDDQIFDGASFALNPGGHLAVLLPEFEEQTVHIDLERSESGWRIVEGIKSKRPDSLEQDYRAMVVALRDYLNKSDFKEVVLGLSGGIDSALVATLAVDALGAENVRCVMLSSEFTSEQSVDHAERLVHTLGCRFDDMSIELCRAEVMKALAPIIGDIKSDIAEENIQSRLRGLLLMALSNTFGAMLLTTGNKSEIAVGYATLYGDMSGGYNPIKDLYKTRVFEISQWRNSNYREWMQGPSGVVIPDDVIQKPPTAELRENQKDCDTLPEYPVLDSILNILIDQDGSLSDCVHAGHDYETAREVEHLIYSNEHKRFQSAPGTRLTKRAFWLDRRYPITNRWRDLG